MFREMGNKFWIITNNQNNSVTGDEFFNAFLKVGMRLVPVNYRMTDLFDTVTNHVQFRKSTFHSLRHCRCSVQENGCNMTHAVGRERKNVSRDVGPVTQSAAGHSRSRGPLKRVSLPGFRHSTLPQWLSYSSEPVNCETVIASSSRQLIGKKCRSKPSDLRWLHWAWWSSSLRSPQVSSSLLSPIASTLDSTGKELHSSNSTIRTACASDFGEDSSSSWLVLLPWVLRKFTCSNLIVSFVFLTQMLWNNLTLWLIYRRGFKIFAVISLLLGAVISGLYIWGLLRIWNYRNTPGAWEKCTNTGKLRPFHLYWFTIIITFNLTCSSSNLRPQDHLGCFGSAGGCCQRCPAPQETEGALQACSSVFFCSHLHSAIHQAVTRWSEHQNAGQELPGLNSTI